MGSLYLALQYLRFYRARAFLLVVCLTVTTCLPCGLHVLVRHYRAELTQRAGKTPLILGVKGHRYDLAMAMLYFRLSLDETISMGDLDRLRGTTLAEGLPLLVRYTARGVPIAGVTADYFRFRALRLAQGRLPAILGEATVGAKAARRLGVNAGDTILSDQRDLYNLAATYPLRMHVVGVLAPAGSADDEAVFCDIKTTWVIAGIAHGHADLSQAGQEGGILTHQDGNIVGNASVTTFVEITPKNLESFHLHAERDELPVTGLICLPKDDKAGTILKARYKISDTRQMLVPADVVGEIFSMVFRVEAFLQMNFAVVGVSTALLVTLIVLLTIRLRRDEMDTLHRIGCSRRFVAGMQIAEWICILLASLAIAGAVVFVIRWAAPNLSRLL